MFLLESPWPILCLGIAAEVVLAIALAAFLARGETLRRAVDASQRYIAFRLQRVAS